MRYRTLFRTRPLFDQDGGSGSGSGAQTGDQGNPPNLQGLLQRHNNDAMAVIATLLSENHGYRERIRTLSGQVPAEGAVVLVGEQAQAWQAYQQLGAAPDLQQRLAAAETAAGELTALKRQALIGQVAEAAGYKPSVLARLAGEQLGFDVREAQVDGKPVKTVVVKDGDTEAPLADYATQQWADFLPALQAQQAAPQGTSFISQSSGGQAPANVLDAYARRIQEQRDQAANPLAAAAGAARSPLS